MIIKLDTVVMNQNQLTPNYYVMLYYIHNNLPHKLGPNTKVALQKLEFLDSQGNLTNKVEQLFKEKTSLKELTDEELKDFLKELVNIFPKGVKTAGQYVKSAVGNNLLRKFKKWLAEYDYSKDTIIKATEAYVKVKKRENFNYMMVFTYFIEKQGVGSTLASYCQAIEDGEQERTTETRIERTL